MELEFSGPVIHWRGPSPHHFVTVPDEESQVLKELSHLSYGWGCIPVRGRIGRTDFETSLIPKDGRFLVPLKVVVRRAEALDVGDDVTIRLTVEAD
jgi:hypothetical protein